MTRTSQTHRTRRRWSNLFVKLLKKRLESSAHSGGRHDTQGRDDMVTRAAPYIEIVENLFHNDDDALSLARLRPALVACRGEQRPGDRPTFSVAPAHSHFSLVSR